MTAALRCDHFVSPIAVTLGLERELEIMAVTNVTTLTVKPGGWDDMMENTKKAKVILEKHGAKNVRLLVPVSGGGPSGTVHSTFEADDLAGVGKILDGIYTDPAMIELMTSGADSASWESSILLELPLS